MAYPGSVVRACRTYIRFIQRMQTTCEPDPEAMEEHEAKRVVLHNSVLVELTHAHIPYRDRWDAEQIAWRIATSAATICAIWLGNTWTGLTAAI